MSVEKNAYGKNSYLYQIQLPGMDFQGPLDLLLQLIERKELPITSIALADITEEYLGYINRLSEVDPSELAEFLVIASKLLLIKSYALLPRPPATSNEVEDAATAAQELINQLRQYQQVKYAASVLRLRQELGLRAFASHRVGLPEGWQAQRQFIHPSQPITAPPSFNLREVLALVRRRLNSEQQQQLKLPLEPTATDLANLVRKVKIEDKISLIENRLRDNSPRAIGGGKDGGIAFSSLFDPANPPSDTEIIVTFMAVLELLRRRQVTAEQTGLFGDILISDQPPT